MRVCKISCKVYLPNSLDSVKKIVSWGKMLLFSKN